MLGKIRLIGKVMLVLSGVCFLLSMGVGSFAKETKGLVIYLSPNQFDEFQTTASMFIRKYVEEDLPLELISVRSSTAGEIENAFSKV